MRVSTLPPADLFSAPLFAEYAADPELALDKALLRATVDPRPFLRLFKEGAGRPSWPVPVMLGALVLQRQNGWHDRELVRQMRDNARVRFLIGLPLGTRCAPSKTAVGSFRRALVAAGMGMELFEQQVRWIGVHVDLVHPEKDDFAIDATRFEASAAQPTIVGLLQDGVRRVLLAVRAVAPGMIAPLDQRFRLKKWLGRRFQRCARGIESRVGRREWRRCYHKAERVLGALGSVRDQALVAEAIAVLRRIMEERGPEGTGKPEDRLSNARDSDARFGCKGSGRHQITWHGGKVSVIAHVPTDLILALDVMPANAVDGSAMARCNDQAKALLQGRRLRRLHGDAAYSDEEHRYQMASRNTDVIGPRRGKVRRGRVRGGGLVATKADRGIRSHIERVQANMVRWRHNRRAWYIGLAKGRYQAALSAVAANLARLRTLILAGKVSLPNLA